MLMKTGGGAMLDDSVVRLYHKFRLDSYQQLFRIVRERDGSLSATEAFSADIINLLGEPTVTQFASAIGISQPNATYKINNLVAKGYVKKVVPDTDRREVRLEAADKFKRYFREEPAALHRASASLKQSYTPEQIALASRVLDDLLAAIEKEEDKANGSV
jgi:DNA-binding MarR family transcriptional regulator